MGEWKYIFPKPEILKKRSLAVKKLSDYQRRMLLIFLTANLILFAVSAVYAYIIDSADGRDIVGCSMKHLLRIYCPGCGGSRSLVFLFKFDFISSFRAYPPMAALLFFLIDIDLRSALSIVRDDPSYLRRFKLNSLLVIPIVLLIHFFIRNFLLIRYGIDPLGDLINFYT